MLTSPWQLSAEPRRDVRRLRDEVSRLVEEASSGLSSTEVERMRKEAEAHAAEDRRQRELIDARNQADQMVYQVEKLLKDNADKLTQADRAPLESAIAHVKEEVTREDVAAIRRAIGELEQASQAMLQHLQQSAQTAGVGAGTGGRGQGGHGDQDQEDVVDADFEVKE